MDRATGMAERAAVERAATAQGSVARAAAVRGGVARAAAERGGVARAEACEVLATSDSRIQFLYGARIVLVAAVYNNSFNI